MTCKSSPKVSVCIPTYNYGKYISAAIDSVLAQTFTDIELIVVDNCSNDNTKEIVEKYVAADSRIHYYRNETNVGMVANWNRCLHYATGEYVKILCADDILDSTYLEKTAKILDDYPSVVLVSTARVVVDMDLQLLEVYQYSNRFEIVSGPTAISRVLLTWNLIGEPTAVLFRQKNAGRGFDGNYIQEADIEMWFHLLEQGDFAFLPEKLCKFRQHAEQTTNSNLKMFAIYDDKLRLFNSYSNHLAMPFLKKEMLRFNKVYDIWCTAKNGQSKGVIKEKIAGYYPLIIFYLLLAVKKSKKCLAIRSNQ